MLTRVWALVNFAPVGPRSLRRSITSTMRVRCVLAAALLLGPMLPAAAADGSPKTEARTPAAKFPSGIDVEFERLDQVAPDEYVMEGSVTIRSERSRIQADRVRFRANRYIEAEGNVLLVWGTNRIAGPRMTYDLEEERGEIEDAIGQVDPEFFFTARRVRKIGDDLILLTKASVTTCTQPTPYWSLAVSSARIRIDHYAHMFNLRLKAKKVPIFYLPYLLWPVKRDRAAGLLFPTFGSTQDRGRVVGLPVFIPLGRSADLTLVGEYYTTAGLGFGAELNFVPNAGGSGTFNGFFIRDKVSNSTRYRFTYRQTQQFRNGFRMVADVNQVSDFDFFTDYERELKLVSSPTILARVEFSRNGPWTSMNVRELRRKQLFADGTDLVQQTLPELEFRGRSRRLGKSPFYLSYEMSFASIQQRGVQLRTVTDTTGGSAVQTTVRYPFSPDYYRADLFPTLSASLSPVPWIDITPTVSYRYTFYTQQQASVQRAVRINGKIQYVTVNDVVDSALGRGTASAGLEIVGPKIFRIYRRPGDAYSTRYKHVFETRIAYLYREAYDRAGDILRYDEVDQSPTASNQVTYGFRTRLFALRPRQKPQPARAADEGVILPEGTGEDKEQPARAPTSAAATPAEASAAAGPPGRSAPARPPSLEPVEIASLEVRQSLGLERDLSSEDVNQNGRLDPFEDLNGDGVLQRSRRSPIEAIGRFSPSYNTSLDLRASYDELYRRLSELSLSGNLRFEVARAGFSFVRTAAGPDDPYRTQLRLSAGVTLLGGKLKLDVDGSYDAAERTVPDQRWRMELYTQCCGFLAEYMSRSFVETTRREFRFTVDLRGIGKLLDLHEGGSR